MDGGRMSDCKLTTVLEMCQQNFPDMVEVVLQNHNNKDYIDWMYDVLMGLV